MARPDERFRDLEAIVGEHMPGGPPEAKMATAICNSCGSRLTITGPGDVDLGRLMALAMTGWGRDLSREHDNDLCPACNA